MKEKWKHLYLLEPAHTNKKTENLDYSNLSSSQLIKNAIKRSHIQPAGILVRSYLY